MSEGVFARTRTRERDGYHCIAALAAGTCTSHVSVVNSCARTQRSASSLGCDGWLLVVFEWCLTGAPGDVVGLHLVEDGAGAGVAVDVGDAADQDVELAGEAGAELLNGRGLLLGADDAGDGPGALEEQRGEHLGDLAVAAEDEDVVGAGHFVCVFLLVRLLLLSSSAIASSVSMEAQ